MKTIKPLPSFELLEKHFLFDYEAGKVFRKMHPELLSSKKDSTTGYNNITQFKNRFYVTITTGGRFFRTCTTLEEAIEVRDNHFKELYPTGLDEVICNTESKGYKIFSFNNSRYKLHRVLYYMYHKIDIGSKQIDHIDQNKANNSIENLRLASNAQNNMNRIIQKNNKSGVRGVHKHTTKHKDKTYVSWMAEIRKNRKALWSKLYPYTDEGLEQASIDVSNKRKELFGEFYHN